MRPSSKVMSVLLMKKMMGAADEVPLMAFENGRIIVPPPWPEQSQPQVTICIYIYIEDACGGSSPHPFESANLGRI